MKIFLLSSLLIFCLWGCSMRQHPLHPPIALRGNVTNSQQESRDKSQGVQKCILSQESLSLEDCFQLALLYSDQLKLSGENYYQALLLREKAWAAILPSLNLKTNYTFQEEAAQFGSLREKHEEKITLEQPLFSGFKEYYGLGQTRSLILSQASLLRHEQTQIFLNVSAAFYEILKFESTLQTLNSLIELQQKRLNETRERFTLGLVRKTEILLIEADLEDTKAKQVRTLGDLQAARAQLNVLLGIETDKSLRDVADTDETRDLNALLNLAYMNRQDLISLGYDRETARQQVSYIAGEFWPSVVLTGNIYLDRNGPQENVDWDISIGASLPLYEGGEIRTQLKEAQSKLRQAEILYDLQKKIVTQEVTQAFALSRALAEEAKALKKKVELVEENYLLTQEEHQQGLATQLDLQWVYQEMANVKLSYEQSLWSFKFSRSQLSFACGAPLQEYQNPNIKNKE